MTAERFDQRTLENMEVDFDPAKRREGTLRAGSWIGPRPADGTNYYRTTVHI
jgi:hypothetical protein